MPSKPCSRCQDQVQTRYAPKTTRVTVVRMHAYDRLRALALELHVYEDPFWTFWTPGAALGDMPFAALAGALRAQDWAGLRAALCGCAALEAVRIALELRPMLDGKGRLPSDVPRCRAIVRECVEALLPPALARITTVDVACTSQKA